MRGYDREFLLGVAMTLAPLVVVTVAYVIISIWGQPCL